jgi:hypothetical protein
VHAVQQHLVERGLQRVPGGTPLPNLAQLRIAGLRDQLGLVLGGAGEVLADRLGREPERQMSVLGVPALGDRLGDLGLA